MYLKHLLKHLSRRFNTWSGKIFNFRWPLSPTRWCITHAQFCFSSFSMKQPILHLRGQLSSFNLSLHDFSQSVHVLSWKGYFGTGYFVYVLCLSIRSLWKTFSFDKISFRSKNNSLVLVYLNLKQYLLAYYSFIVNIRLMENYLNLVTRRNIIATFLPRNSKMVTIVTKPVIQAIFIVM